MPRVVAAATVRKVAEKAPKAAAKSTSNHSPAPHGGPNPLCGLGILGSPQTRLSVAGGSSHALSRVSGCRSRRAAHFFVHNNMDNPLLGRDHAPAAKREYEGIRRNESSQTCRRFGTAGVRSSDVF